MSIALPETFTYTDGDGTPYTVGGSGATASTTILNRFGFADDQDQAEFHWIFVVEATSSSDLATKCGALEAALRQRYGTLVASFGSAVQYVFNPSTTTAVSGVTSSGWDGEPSLKKAEGWPHSALARAYHWRFRCALPPNFTDAYGAAAGRRSADANLHYDVNERQVVSLRGVWTQVVGSLARPQFASQIDAYANYRLTLIDPTAAWTYTRRDESDPQSLSTLTWSREFSQVIAGRRGTTRDPVIQASGLRLVTIRGTYLRTYGGTPKTASQNYAADVTTQVTAELAAIPAIEGGALTLGQDCETISQSSPTNEQDDRVDFTWVIRELRVVQANNTNFLNDPNIVLDSITLVIRHNPLNDSPEPAAVDQTAGAPVSAPPTPNPSGGDTVTRPAGVGFNLFTKGGPGSPSPPGGKTGGTEDGTSTPVVKPVDVFARYEATFKASVAQFQQYYELNVRGMLERALAVQLGVSPVVMVDDSASFDIQNCKVSADIHCQAYPGSLIALRAEQSITNDTGLHFDGVFNGNPYNFLVQPGLPDRTMIRLVRAFYLTGSGYDVTKFASTPWTPGQTGWVLFRTSSPQKVTTVTGIPGLGYGTLAITSETLVEELRWVAANAGAGVSGASPPNGAASSSTTGGGAGAPVATGPGAGAPSAPGGPADVPQPQPAGSNF